MLQEARAFGMSEVDIETLRRAVATPASLTTDEAGIWPENVPIVAAFLVAQTQWNVVGIGGGLGPGRLVSIGLNYQDAIAGITAAGITVTPDLWAGVRIMEAAALEALNEVYR